MLVYAGYIRQTTRECARVVDTWDAIMQAGTA